MRNFNNIQQTWHTQPTTPGNRRGKRMYDETNG